jgi:hypothetical protein
LTVGFSDLEAQEEEAEFLVASAREGTLCIEKTSPTTREKVGS